MKIQELCLGNLVSYQGKQFNVVGIFLDKVDLKRSCESTTESLTVLFSEICPIPLSEEFFKERLCFVEDNNCGYPILENKDLRMDTYETTNGWHVHIDDCEYCTAYSGTIKYVHTLQNAFFLSTGNNLNLGI